MRCGRWCCSERVIRRVAGYGRCVNLGFIATRRIPIPTTVRIFTDHTAAEAARQAVLNTSLAREHVTLSHQGDEAGALCGSFLYGDCEPDGESVEIYERKFRNVVIGGRFALTFNVEPVQMDIAKAALQPTGGYAVGNLRPQY